MGVKMKIISIFISFLFLSFSLNADTIKYWTTEEQPARMMKQVKMAVDFNKASGHNGTVIEISEIPSTDLSFGITKRCRLEGRNKMIKMRNLMYICHYPFKLIAVN